MTPDPLFLDMFKKLTTACEDIASVRTMQDVMLKAQSEQKEKINKLADSFEAHKAARAAACAGCELNVAKQEPKKMLASLAVATGAGMVGGAASGGKLGALIGAVINKMFGG